jgi:hypothetical protein
LPAKHKSPCTAFDVREAQPKGRCIGRIYKDISAGWQWFWFLNDRSRLPTRAKAMLLLKQRWIQRGPLKPGEMQVGTLEWMKNRPEYQRVIAENKKGRGLR